MFSKLKKEQVENIQIDHGLVFVNYGTDSQRQLGPTKGGCSFTASKVIRDIDFDGSMGKTKGLQVIEEMGAMLSFAIMDTSLSTLAVGLPDAEYDETLKIIKNGQGGVIPTSKYLENITMFAKTAGGKYKKITLFNALNESDLVLSTAPKAEGEIPFEVNAHWNPEDENDLLYSIEDVDAYEPDSI
ncbi:hypothetical protein ACJ2A9_04855 [Anaerobacillus sp. MEB173]|uniref:hypothetical protein n=1 Tax=Anaerobacillus sp. MEB173 TaxID=3383345 RepID=UPI003F9242F4